MEIDTQANMVSLSVGELAQFRQSGKTAGYGASLWRAQVGQEWHKVAAEKTKIDYPEAVFESSIQVNYTHRSWQFSIVGRIDQILPIGQKIRLREVKSIRYPLPADLESLRFEYPEYLIQAATYLWLAQYLPEFTNKELSAELYFINIESGSVQSIPITLSDAKALTLGQLDRMTAFLDARSRCRDQLKNAQLKPAFKTLRPGQEALFQQLERAQLQSETILLEAPTGFGKTGIVLEHALKQLKSGLFERCIYLTTKSTGQLETIEQLKRMVGDQVRYIQMRNRSEHQIDTPAHSCNDDGPCTAPILESWDEYGIEPYDLLKSGTLTIESAQSIAAEIGICPYLLRKSCLPYAELWIGDLNYIFSQESQHVFMDSYSFDPKKTLLIVDEAHNLADRVADNRSVSLSAADLLFAIESLRDAGAPRRLISIGLEITRFIDALPEAAALCSHSFYEALDLCEDFAHQLQQAQMDYAQLSQPTISLIWSIHNFAQRMNEPSHDWLYWIQKSGTLKATCLNSSQSISQIIGSFGASILMSATLSPIETFKANCGLQRVPISYAIGHASWRDQAYTVAIDTRVDTRLRTRERYYETTARTIASLIHSSPGQPIAVFFAAYKYAQNVLAYLETIAPHYRISLQPRGVNLEKQESYIDTALLTTDALFLILGSSYSEGIDKLGGRVERVMMVGPALPEVNLIQEAKMDLFPSMQREAAFEEVYIRPAMRRIHQALGRLVRAPGQKAKVLLHDQRFAESAYFRNLATEYQTDIQIKNDAELDKWLYQS